MNGDQYAATIAPSDTCLTYQQGVGQLCTPEANRPSGLFALAWARSNNENLSFEGHSMGMDVGLDFFRHDAEIGARVDAEDFCARMRL